MTTFNITDKDFRQKVVEHLKTFDRFDRLKITAETDLNDTSLQIMLEIDDTRRCFYTYDLSNDLFELAKELERTVYYLSWQTEFVKDLKELIGSSADSMNYSYSFDLETYAHVDAWRPYQMFDFSLRLNEENDLLEIFVTMECSHSSNGITFNHQLVTEKWLHYSDLETIYHQFLQLAEELTGKGE